MGSFRNPAVLGSQVFWRMCLDVSRCADPPTVPPTAGQRLGHRGGIAPQALARTLRATRHEDCLLRQSSKSLAALGLPRETSLTSALRSPGMSALTIAR